MIWLYMDIYLVLFFALTYICIFIFIWLKYNKNNTVWYDFPNKLWFNYVLNTSKDAWKQNSIINSYINLSFFSFLHLVFGQFVCVQIGLIFWTICFFSSSIHYYSYGNKQTYRISNHSNQSERVWIIPTTFTHLAGKLKGNFTKKIFFYKFFLMYKSGCLYVY